MQAITKQILFVETITDSLSEGFDVKNTWLINLCFGEKHTLLIMDLIKRLVEHCVFLCNLFEQMEDW